MVNAANPSVFCYNVFMKLNFEINNQTKNRVDKKLIRLVVLKTLKKSGLVFLNNKKISISLAFVSPKEIKKLNRVYRRKDKVTDILSFSEYKTLAHLKKERKHDIFLGELVLCYDDIKGYAKKNKLDLKKELIKAISHGILHLLGFSHGNKMFSIQEEISNKFNR